MIPFQFFFCVLMEKEAERKREMMMNIKFDDGTSSAEQGKTRKKKLKDERGRKKKRKKGWTEREKSKQVIITHPKLFHCRSHLGLIKTTKIGLIIIRTTNADITKGKNVRLKVDSREMRQDGTGKKLFFCRRSRGNESRIEAFLMLLCPSPEPTHKRHSDSSQKGSFIATFYLPFFHCYWFIWCGGGI